jgi:hypothetical protein
MKVIPETYPMKVNPETYPMKVILCVARNIPHEGYSRNIPHEGYSRNILTLISTFFI